MRRRILYWGWYTNYVIFISIVVSGLTQRYFS